MDPVPEQAFRDAAVSCLDSLYGFALALCRDSVEAEDLVQETYLRALRARNKAEPDQGLRSWMFAILHNIWRNDVRRHRPVAYEGDLDGLPSGDGDPMQAVDRKQSGNRLRAAIEALPGAFREVIVLRCVEGFSYREMAQIVGCPAGTVMSRLARARAAEAGAASRSRAGRERRRVVKPITCDAARRLVLAYVDGELVGDERTSFEAHVEDCDACRHAIRDEVALGQALGSALPPARAPEGLRARVEALLDPPRRKSASRRWALIAAAVLALAAVESGYVLGRRSPTPAVPSPPAEYAPPGDLAALAADTHLRYTRGQLPLEIGSAKPEEVSHWFSGRVPFNLALPDYPVAPGERKFYRLQGGRLVSFRGDYAAYVAYSMEDRPISLIVTSAGLARPAGGETVRFRSLTFHTEAVQGLKVITWTDKGLTYALASDLSVRGEQSCMVCHGSPEDRRLIEGFSDRPQS